MQLTSTWDGLNEAIVSCEQCPRLRGHCLQVASEKRKAFRDETYWGQPVPNFGDPQARVLIVGLAPAAHGANRTGRMFTGDRSGEWLFRALHRAGFANQAAATGREDGLRLIDCAITATCHCAPPDNRPEPVEIENCRPFLQQTFDLLPARVFVALGQIGWSAISREAVARGWLAKKPHFSHGASVSLGENRWMIGSYHPSQQNTFTGRLTEDMLDEVFRNVRSLLPP